MNAKETLRRIGKKFTPAYITKIALLTAIAFVLYAFLKFKLPTVFPSFLEMQFSELPAILAGFSMGPLAGALVIIFKCLLKFPMTSTAFVGELTDILLGLAYVLPASILYMRRKDRKHALLGLLLGTFASTAAAILVNRFISVPFYVELFFKGDFHAIVGVCSALYPHLTRDNFYLIYLTAGVLPFNVLRLSLVSLVTFLVYKRLSAALHWEIKPRNTTETVPEEGTETTSESLEEEPFTTSSLSTKEATHNSEEKE